MRVAWTFYDPVEDETYSFAINPKSGGSPSRPKNMTYQSTAAPNGRVVAFEGAEPKVSISFSGTLLTEAQYTALNTWRDKKNQILLTDDLGREFWIYIEGLNLTRELSRNYPWRHEFSVDAFVLDWE